MSASIASPDPGTVVWEPPADVRRTSRVGAYLDWLRHRRGRVFEDYWSLWRWSVEDLTGFWASIWDYFGLEDGAVGGAYDRVLSDHGMPVVDWFPGATLNYAEHLLRNAPCDVAVVARSQTRAPVELTGSELTDAVARARAGLIRLGVGRGDRVAAYLPNIPEALVLLLATASLGAVFSSCAAEFGVRGVVDRLGQIRPKVLVAADGYRYGDKAVSRTAEVTEIAAELADLSHVVWVPYLADTPAPPAEPPDEVGSLTWSELTESTAELAFEPVPFDHPLYVLYSSGTTGLPKPIVHGHGGILIEHVKTLAFHLDLGPGDRFFWFSTTGWMMWNKVVSGLAVGAAVVLYDGNPAHPDLGELWRMADEAGVTFFGTSAPYLLSCRKAGLSPKDIADTSRIRGVGSTGAPLPPEGFGWVYAEVGSSLLLQSFCGGTDVCTGFIGGSPLLPVYAGELSCPTLGAAVAAYSPTGESMVGELGELVLERPMPSMPVGLWGDDSGERYRAAYFEEFPGVWRHGDWVTITDHGACVITGRSDATLNRGGVRLGTAEFYSVVEALPEVSDSLVVHLEDDVGGSGELLLFVVPAEGASVDEALKRSIATELRAALSPRHVPDQVIGVAGVPRTLSGKKLEVPVKRILTGTPVDRAASRSALADPSALDAFTALATERASGHRAGSR